MVEHIFWSGYCFGVAAGLSVCCSGFLIALIVKKIHKNKVVKLKSKKSCEGCYAFDPGFGCVCMTKCPQITRTPKERGGEK